jgi:hypothetical protein
VSSLCSGSLLSSGTRCSIRSAPPGVPPHRTTNMGLGKKACPEAAQGTGRYSSASTIPTFIVDRLYQVLLHAEGSAGCGDVDYGPRRSLFVDACPAAEVHADGDIPRARRRDDFSGERIEGDFRENAVKGLVALPFVLAGEFLEFGRFFSELTYITELESHLAVNGIHVGEVHDREVYMETAIRSGGKGCFGDGFAGIVVFV